MKVDQLPTNRSKAPAATTSGKVIFVNRFYAPDLSATSQILTDVAEQLASRNYRISVFTSRIGYSAKEKYKNNETIKGVTVHRVWSTSFGRASLLGRSIDYLSFYISITIALFFHVSRQDIVIAKTDPPMLSVPLGLVVRLKRAKLVNWLQDIFPETAMYLGIGSSKNPLAKILQTLRNRSLKTARMNVTIGGRMAKVVQDFGVDPNRVCVIHNFVDDESIRKSLKHSPSLRKKWGIATSDFVVGYSGNLGRAHDINTMMQAAELLKENQTIKFLIIGGGFHFDQIAEEIEKRQLLNISLQPYQPRTQLNASLALPNLHWASLKDDLEGYIVPSKIYGIAAAGRPLLMIGDPNGEIGDILTKFPFGRCVNIGDSRAVASFILEAQKDYGFLKSMGEIARSFIDLKASRNHAISSWETLIQSLNVEN